MGKLRKMLGDIKSQECISLMRLIETQSADTLAAWAIGYAKKNYLEIYNKECTKDERLENIIKNCGEYLNGNVEKSELKLLLKEGTEIARNTEDNPIAQAAARAIAAACGTIQTPTNALGFLFYGAAAASYSRLGFTQKQEEYDKEALLELQRALKSLRQEAIQNEENPVRIKWNC